MNDLQVIDEERSIQEVTTQVAKIQTLMSAVMKQDEHYGVIPGTGKKPSLLKPGAEKLCFVFRLVPSFEIDREDFPNGHREYRVKCILKTMGSGAIVGEGVGSCSTMESKYRYRSGPVEFTGRPVPKEYWDMRDSNPEEALKAIGGKGHSVKKNPDTGRWEIVIAGEKTENPDIADVYNTVLKMAKKRAHVDATITACAASDIFTQDVEDMPEFSDHPTKQRQEGAKPVTLAAKPATATNTADIEGLILAAISTGKLSKKDADMWRGKMQNEGTRAAAESYIRSTFGGLAPVKAYPMSAGKETAIDAEQVDELDRGLEAAADAGFGEPGQPDLY